MFWLWCMPKKNLREEKGQWRYFGFDNVSSVIVTKREKGREMKLGPTMWQGIKIEREIWLCTPGTMRQIERSKWREKEQRLWEKEQHEREKINPIFPNSRHLHEWFKPMLQNQIYPWNYQAMPKKIQRKKRDNGDILALTLSAVSLSQREKRRERWSWDQRCNKEQI